MKSKVETGFTAFANWVANAAGRPLMFTLALGFFAAWALLGSRYDYSDHWLAIGHTVAAIVTFLMVFLIQNSQNRDTASMQAKLDELLRAVGTAREQLIGIEHLPADEVEEIRAGVEQETRGGTGTDAAGAKR